MMRNFLLGVLSLMTAFPIGIYSQDKLSGTASVSATGGGVYAVQIQTPKGVGDLQPSIALSYNSQAGNGVAGWGCNITGISVITRGMKDIAHDGSANSIRYTTTDALYLDGKRLIKVSGTEGADGTVYSPEGESLTKITLHGSLNSTSSWFEADTNDGMTYEFGHASGTQQTTVANSTQVPHAWYISKATNNLGQTITYQYLTADRYLYPQTISYGGGNTVSLDYETRTDSIRFVLNGLKGCVGKRLKKITAKVGSNVFRTYTMSYTSGFDNSTTTYPRLEYITETGELGNGSRRITLGWDGLPAFSPTCNNAGITLPEDDNLHEYGERFLMAGDVNGDGVSDIIHVSPVTITNSSSGHNTKSTHNYLYIYNSQINNGSVSYKTPLSINFDGTISLGSRKDKKGNPICVDLDGDGIKDVLVPGYRTGHDNNHIFYLIYAFGKDISSSRTTSYSKNIDFGSYGYPLFCCDDFNNDGKCDIFLMSTLKGHGNYHSCYILSVENDSIVTKKSFRMKMEGHPGRVFSSDYNGDGLSDIMIICDDGYRIYNNSGNSLFPENSTLNDEIKSNYQLEQGDFNGDGIVDFVWNNHNSKDIYFELGNGNGTFTKRLAYTLPYALKPRNTDEGTWSFLVVDLDHDGKSDVVINAAAYSTTYLKTFTHWFFSTGQGLFLRQTSSSVRKDDAKAGHICVGDFKGKGWLEVMNYGYDCWGGNNANVSPTMHIYSCSSQKVSDGKVKSVTDSDGRTTSFTYGSMASDKLYTKGTGSNYPVIDVAAPLCVVSQVKESGASSVTRKTSYTYKGLRAHLQGRGILGFSEQTAKEQYTGRNVTTAVKGWNSQYCIPFKTLTTTTQGGYTSTSTSRTRIVASGSNYALFPDSLIETDIYGNTTTTRFLYNVSLGYLRTVRTYYGGSSMYRETIYSTPSVKVGGAYRPTAITQKQKHLDSSQTYSDKTTYSYNSNGLPVSVTEHSNTTLALNRAYEYDANGNVTKETVSGEGITTPMVTNYQYSGGRFLTRRTTTPASMVTGYGYNAFGELTAVNDMTASTSSPLATTYTRDGFGMVTKETKPTGEETSYSRTVNDNGYVIEERGNDGRIVTTQYDALGNELSTATTGIAGIDISTENTYNAKGLLTLKTHRKGSLTTTESMTYDALGRLLSCTSSSGRSTAYGYGNRTVTTTDNGRQYTKTYDAWGNVTSASDPQATVTYTYHSNGKPSSAASGGATVYMGYDAAGNQTSLEDPDAGITTYEYDALGRIVRQTDARGKETAYTFDAVGKLTKRICGSIVTNYTYGTSGAEKERLIKEQTGSRWVTYAYNDKGQLSSETRTVQGETPATFNYRYNAVGQLSSKDYPKGVTVDYKYDCYGNRAGSEIGGRCVSLLTTDDGQTAIVEYGGTIQGGPPSIIHRKGAKSASFPDFSVTNPVMTHTTTYNSNGLLTGLSLKRGSATTNLRSMTFNFDGATGNLLRRTGMSSLMETFQYDNLDRLTKVKHGLNVAQEIGYSTNGNIVSKTGVGTLYYDGQKPHAVSAADNTSGYIPSTTQQVTYTPFGKVETLTDGDYSMTFTYGPDEERWKTVLKKNGTVKRKVFYAGDYERVTENGTTRHFFYLDNGCIYVINDSLNTGRYYYAFTDHLGSVTRIYDDFGLSSYIAEYDAWGKQTVTKNTIHFQRGYTGHEMLPEFGLINMNGRLYDPVLGRFLSPDNYVQMPNFSQSFNRYAYCINNPLKYKDPDGEWFGIDDLLASVIGGAVNLGMNLLSGDVHSFGQGISLFFAGAAAGELSLYGQPALAAVVIGAGNSLINQSFNNGSVDWMQVATAGGMSLLTYGFSEKLSPIFEKPISSLTNKITNSVVREALNNGLVNSATGFSLGLGFGLVRGDSFSESMQDGLSGAATGLAIGAITGASIELGTKLTPRFEQKELTPYEKGQLGVKRAKQEFIDDGGIIYGEQMSIEVDGVRIRPDFIGYKDNVLHIYEVKNGPKAGFTPNQKVVIPKILDNKPQFFFKGGNASRIPNFNTLIINNKPYTGDFNFVIKHYY